MSAISETPLYPYRRSPDQDRRARHPVVVVGAGPVGLTLAIDLALQDVPVVVLDESDRVGTGSRAICFAKRTLEICDRLGVGDPCAAKGVTWNTGKVFFGERQVYAFDLLPEAGHRRPAFVNLQQYHFERFLVDRLRALEAEGRLVELRGCNRVTAVEPDGAALTVETPEGPYEMEADWVVACDGAGSPVRGMLGLGFEGRVFEDNFLIADVRMQAEFPAERRFWFDPPFNPGQSALLHRQPDGVWRIDLQLGQNIDREAEKRPERVIPRIRAMLGEEVDFELEWVSIYTFQCRRMARFREGRVIFAGDAAHQVSPFGARGANSGIQGAENLVWKLALVHRGAPESLIDSYEAERIPAADENILASTRSTDFITPKSPVSRTFRDAVLTLAERAPFARPLVNSGRLSVPAVYESPLSTPDALPAGPARTRPGAPCPDAPVGDGWLLDRLGGGFRVLGIGTAVPKEGLSLPAEGALAERYLGKAPQAVYLIRPDQHVAARWPAHDAAAMRAALARASGC